MALAGLATLYTTMQPTPLQPEANFFLYGINRLVSDDPQTISPLTIDAPLRLPFMAGAALGAIGKPHCPFSNKKHREQLKLRSNWHEKFL